MKKSVLLSILFSAVLALSGCSSAINSIELRLSGQKVSPVSLPESASASESIARETLPPQTAPLETESPETLPSETAPPETAPPETEPPVTVPPETASPATDPPAATSSSAFSVSDTEPDAPLQADGCFHDAREFYEGEYVKHLCTGAWLGDDYIPGSELTFSQERLDRPGLVTVTVSWHGHKDERTFEVLPKEQFELTMADLEWFSCSERAFGTKGMRLSAAWFYERLMNIYPHIVSYRPLPSDVIPEEEFQFSPSVVNKPGTQQVQVTCRGLVYEFWVELN